MPALESVAPAVSIAHRRFAGVSSVLFTLLLAGAAACGWPAAEALAQVSADAPIHLVVPYAAGGPSDLITRRLAEQMGKQMKRSVIVDNRTGGGGSVATGYVARAEPDGNTILWNTSTMAIDPVLRTNLPYDVVRDLTPVTTAMVGPLAVLINPKLPVHGIAELVAYAKGHPGKLNFGSSGVGTSLHLATEQFMLATGIRMTHIPYKGASQGVVGVISNDIQLLFNPLPTAIQYGRSGELRALAVTTQHRSSILPDLPTVAESGIPALAHYDASIWYAFFVPSKTPAAVVDKLNASILAVLHDPQTSKWLAEQGMEVLGDTPPQSRKRLSDEIQRWAQVVKTANIKLE
jgi:tripartite-type tricarboxylate transporter receptor subunit TctC